MTYIYILYNQYVTGVLINAIKKTVHSVFTCTRVHTHTHTHTHTHHHSHAHAYIITIHVLFFELGFLNILFISLFVY